MPISVIVGIVPRAGWRVRSKSVLEDIGQFPGHLEPQGIDPDVGVLPSPSCGFTCVSKTCTCRSSPVIGCLALRELGDEVLGQLGADLRVPLLGLEDQLVEPRTVVAGVRARSCTSGSPCGGGACRAGTRAIRPRHRRGPSPATVVGGVLQGLGDPIGLQQHFGDGGDQRPVGLDRRGDLGPEAGLAGRCEVEQVDGRTFQKGFLDVSEQRPLQAREGLDLGDRAGEELDLPQGNSLFDLAGGGDVAIPHVPAQPPGSGQFLAGVSGSG